MRSRSSDVGSGISCDDCARLIFLECHSHYIVKRGGSIAINVGPRSYGLRMRKKPSAEAAARRLRFDRVRLLNEELDRLSVDAAERTASVSNKASFLAVAAGVLIAAVTAQLWRAAPAFGIVALGFACLGLASAAIALRPGKRLGIQARRLVDRHLDCEHSAAQVEDELVRDKATVLNDREKDIADRGRWVWIGFGGVAFAALSLSLVFSIEILGG